MILDKNNGKERSSIIKLFSGLVSLMTECPTGAARSVLDNTSIHRSKKTREAVKEKHSRIADCRQKYLIFLPTKAPELSGCGCGRWPSTVHLKISIADVLIDCFWCQYVNYIVCVPLVFCVILTGYGDHIWLHRKFGLVRTYLSGAKILGI